MKDITPEFNDLPEREKLGDFKVYSFSSVADILSGMRQIEYRTGRLVLGFGDFQSNFRRTRSGNRVSQERYKISDQTGEVNAELSRWIDNRPTHQRIEGFRFYDIFLDNKLQYFSKKMMCVYDLLKGNNEDFELAEPPMPGVNNPTPLEKRLKDYNSAMAKLLSIVLQGKI
ncbi:hypothetical protein J4218_02130 [Candidatus Pacearchaeota archaeon]|nr:hypothetical protein [uncultured archaeon]AQS29152.1 hypothetical protein [uncultured archaeon]MBS3078896.1 hypothetical protein [Candidatus Pacearchaeota archaeon]